MHRTAPFRWPNSENRRRVANCAAVLLLAALPIILLVKGFSTESGFLRLLVVGEAYEARALPELREARPPLKSQDGYDGQFYAQIALDPTLSRPELERALDNPAYRSGRIGLPALAHLIGLGRPAVVLQIYALLNFAFWLALLAVFLRQVGLAQPRDFLLAAALLWNTGTLASLQRALPDFPAVALGVMAVWLTSHKLAAAGLLSAACLVKETALLQIAAVGWSAREHRGALRLVSSWALMTLPLAAWLVYVWWKVAEPGIPARGQIALPFVGLAVKLGAAGGGWWEAVLGGEPLVQKTFELLAPVSLAIQAIYLVRYPRFSSRAWRFGAGFALLLPLLGDPMWLEQHGFCRVLLPLTAAFNLLVHRHEIGSSYTRWFLAGNLGMIWLFLKLLRVG